VSENPWWHPGDDDLGWDEPLPRQIVLAPDYMADLPLWGDGFGYNIDWRFTKSRPSCSTGSPPGSGSSMTTSTLGNPAGGRPLSGTAGLSKPPTWQQPCGQPWAPGQSSLWTSGR
jgi:hypothetical protein